MPLEEPNQEIADMHIEWFEQFDRHASIGSSQPNLHGPEPAYFATVNRDPAEATDEREQRLSDVGQADGYVVEIV
jgi:hypothetical protein